MPATSYTHVFRRVIIFRERLCECRRCQDWIAPYWERGRLARIPCVAARRAGCAGGAGVSPASGVSRRRRAGSAGRAGVSPASGVSRRRRAGSAGRAGVSPASGVSQRAPYWEGGRLARIRCFAARAVLGARASRPHPVFRGGAVPGLGRAVPGLGHGVGAQRARSPVPPERSGCPDQIISRHSGSGAASARVPHCRSAQGSAPIRAPSTPTVRPDASER